MPEVQESDGIIGKISGGCMSKNRKNDQIQKNMRKRLRSCIFLNVLSKNSDFATVQYVQKKCEKIVRFVHTYFVSHAIIITVKTPQYIIQFLLYPIVKIPSPKKTAIEAVFLLCINLLKIGLPSKTCYGIILSCQDNFIF